VQEERNCGMGDEDGWDVLPWTGASSPGSALCSEYEDDADDVACCRCFGFRNSSADFLDHVMELSGEAPQDQLPKALLDHQSVRAADSF